MNEKVKIISTEILSHNWYVLKKITYEYFRNGKWQKQVREAYDRGNGATILLYNKENKTVILTRQFRLPSFINGNPDGLLIEACAACWTGTIPKIVSSGKQKKRPVTGSKMCEKYLKHICPLGL